MWKEYKIKQGEHYSNGPLISIHTQKTITFEAEFTDSCLYHIPGPDMLDINKLYGSTDCYSTMHQNSYRIGWRHNGYGIIEIFAYWYHDGIRGFRKLGDTFPGNKDYYQVSAMHDQYKFWFNNLPEFNIARYKRCNGGIRFRSFPYFGGNQPAPQDMTIKINEL